jgi:hypothetical protein
MSEKQEASVYLINPNDKGALDKVSMRGSGVRASLGRCLFVVLCLALVTTGVVWVTHSTVPIESLEELKLDQDIEAAVPQNIIIDEGQADAPAAGHSIQEEAAHSPHQQDKVNTEQVRLWYIIII